MFASQICCLEFSPYTYRQQKWNRNWCLQYNAAVYSLPQSWWHCSKQTFLSNWNLCSPMLVGPHLSRIIVGDPVSVSSIMTRNRLQFRKYEELRILLETSLSSMPIINHQISVVPSAYPCIYRFMSWIFDLNQPRAFHSLFGRLLLASFIEFWNDPIKTLRRGGNARKWCESIVEQGYFRQRSELKSQSLRYTLFPG